MADLPSKHLVWQGANIRAGSARERAHALVRAKHIGTVGGGAYIYYQLANGSVYLDLNLVHGEPRVD